MLVNEYPSPGPSSDIIYLCRYNRGDIEKLVEGTLPQRRVLDLAPGIGDVIGSDGKEHLLRIMERSLEY